MTSPSDDDELARRVRASIFARPSMEELENELELSRENTIRVLGYGVLVLLGAYLGVSAYAGKLTDQVGQLPMICTSVLAVLAIVRFRR